MLKDKLCFSTLGCTERSLGEVISLASKYGIENLEIRGLSGVLDNASIPCFSDSEIEKTKKMLSEAGISVRVVGAFASFDTREKHEANILEAMNAVLVAAKLGAPYVRVFGNRIRGDMLDACKNVSDGILALCSEAKPYGVCVLLEVHGDFNTAETLAPILDALSAVENFGLIWDIAHSHTAYGENFAEFYDIIRPYIKHVHIKDSGISVDGKRQLHLPGEGDIPIKAIMKKMESDGFGGCYSLEWERHWHKELLPIEDALDAFLAVATEAFDEIS